MKVIAVFALVANIVGYIFSIWLVGSLGMSAYKAYAGQCYKPYAIERYYIDGNLFCKK